MAASEAAASAASKKGVAPARPSRARDLVVFATGVAAAVLAFVGPASVLAPGRAGLVAFPVPGPADGPRTFYDDPELSYALGRRVTGWDAKRAQWLRSRGLGDRRNAPERVVMVTGSQPEPCKGAGGDHLLLRFLKNKVDYCRLHGIELLYNNALLEPSMVAYWAKIPVVRAAMLAHPEAEWVWWVDADAVFTDMDFSLPLARYSRYNLVLYGWPEEVYEKRSWVGLNAGVFLIRNCQWSLDFMDEWASMGPASPEYARWGKTLRDTLSKKFDDQSDDQSALAYLLLTNRERWGKKTYLGIDYYFQGYFAEIVDKLDGVAARYEAAERKGDPALRRRHAEREHLRYAAARNAAVRAVVPGPDGGGQSGWRRPFVTHFTGCNPCGGKRNSIYTREICEDGMRRALGFADDQVLRAYGFRHAAPLNDSVRALPFDYPAARARNN
ncbi:probable glycosyltransferase 6 [Zea mays]|uniref:Glycosyltransferase 6 n=1 Tax=Zea mays TaxID=4577 RepID=K7U776_MAIZE|nr:probable glycosyltransferase 6 [Zea mays]AQK57543.1 Glycosyltransferase 6 [Zea mays]|eukprot:XP_008679453.1 probable glycosyltransferase 6 [Zea mays]